MKIVCENQSGNQITFGWSDPLWVASVDGLGMDYNVYTSKNSGQDGENYNGSDAKMRNIVIALDVKKSDFQTQRNRLYSFFQPRSPGTFFYYEGDESKKIAYYVEKVEPGGTDNDEVRTLTVSLICPDPKFYALTDNLAQLAVWQGCIRFPLRLPPQINAEGQPVTITPDNSINDYDKLMVTGKTVETGSSDKSPDNPYMLSGTDTLTVSDGGSNSQTINLPQTLYSLPDGTADNYDVISGSGTQKVGKVILNGTEAWTANTKANAAYPDYFHAYHKITDRLYPQTHILSSHFPIAYAWNSTALDQNCVYVELDTQYIYIFISKTLLSSYDVAGLETWLAANPVTVLYELATPQTIAGMGQTIPVYHPTTMLSVDAGTLALRCRGKFVVTEKINTLIGNVYNPSAVPMGLTVKFMASGTVVNPSLFDVNRHNLMQINTTMHSGDVITITTGDGNKRVKLTSGGVTSNINNRMAYPPRWLKAYQGDNLYRYNADEGIDNLSVTIKSTQAYWGA